MPPCWAPWRVGAVDDEVKYSSLPEARKIVETRHNLSFSTVLKSSRASSVDLKYAQTQTIDVSTQTKYSSLPEARKIVETRHNLSFSTVLKSSRASSVDLKYAQTQTIDVSTPQQKTPVTVKQQQKPLPNKKPEKPVPKRPTKSPKKVLSGRLPKGSDNQIQQHNRFHCLDEEDMEADVILAEPPNQNKQVA